MVWKGLELYLQVDGVLIETPSATIRPEGNREKQSGGRMDLWRGDNREAMDDR
jgi:hypothetical protein